jgi:hypothetical protein
MFLGVETRRFRNWIYFRPQVKKEGTHLVSWAPLERANFNRWTIPSIKRECHCPDTRGTASNMDGKISSTHGTVSKSLLETRHSPDVNVTTCAVAAFMAAIWELTFCLLVSRVVSFHFRDAYIQTHTVTSVLNLPAYC